VDLRYFEYEQPITRSYIDTTSKKIADFIFEWVWLSVLTLFLCFVVIGCGQNGQVEGGSFQPLEDPAPVIETLSVVTPKKTIVTEVLEVAQTDVLIVIDNSASMTFEQSSMANRFDSFLNQLKGLDWRLGIITTDVSGTGPKKDGNLLQLSGLTDQNYLHSGMNTSVIEESFAKTIQRPAREGSQFEQGIKATYLAIQKKQEFFRDLGSLNVILVSDADETPVRGEKPDIRNNPNELLKMIQKDYPTKPFYFHSLVVKEGDVECLKLENNEAYGRQYSWLSEKTGGIQGSVCEKDYSSQLKLIGGKVSQKVLMLELGCVPLQGSITIENSLQSPSPVFQVVDSRILFEQPLSPGVWTTNYSCQKPEVTQ